MNAAEYFGALRYLQMAPELWEALGTAAERWALNRAFLDQAIADCHTFFVTNAVRDSASFLVRELEHLAKKGIEYFYITW